MAKLCVAHLVRECNGLDNFVAFLDSYRGKPAGIEHDLLIIFKGFQNSSVVDSYSEFLKGINHKIMVVSDEGLDLGVYLAAARAFDDTYFCFLNSFSLILHHNWLKFLSQYAFKDEVGVVGATGSWESHYNAYIKSSNAPESANTSRFLARRLASIQMRRYISSRFRREFLAFPNYHLRTNAFMISRQLLLSLHLPKLRNKAEALRFESGRNGLTQQVLARGLQALVVGCDGKAYEKEKWLESRTFRSGEQENLLIADNQTRRYNVAGLEERAMLREFCWGQPALEDDQKVTGN